MRYLKQIATVLLCSASLMADSYVDCFKGWDLTLGIGFSSLGIDAHRSDNLTVATVRTVSSSDDHWAGGAGSVAVQGKFGYATGFCNNWLLGLSGFAQYNNVDFKFDRTLTLTDLASDVSHTVASQEDHSMPVNLGIELRGGYAYCANQLLYIALAADWGYYKQKFSAYNQSVNFDKWHVGPRLVGGAEQRVCGKLVLKEEFSYCWYNSYSVDHAVNGTDAAGATITGTISHKRTPSLPMFVFHAGYLF